MQLWKLWSQSLTLELDIYRACSQEEKMVINWKGDKDKLVPIMCRVLLPLTL